MLTRVFVESGLVRVKGKIVKFCDRVWLKDLERNELVILRSLVLELDQGSAPVEAISFLEPFTRDRIMEVEDASSTCLKKPEEFRFNRVKTLGYEVIKPAKNDLDVSIIMVDGIQDVEVSLTNSLQILGMPDASVIRVNFGQNPVLPGHRRKLRLRINAQVPEKNLQSLGQANHFGLHLNYLETEDCPVAAKEAAEHATELPFAPILDERHQGGFDVFCYVPLDWEVVDWPTNGKRALLDFFDYTGEPQRRQWQRYTWRMREVLADREHLSLAQIAALPPVASSEGGFPIDCTLKHAGQFGEVGLAVGDLRKTVRTTTWVVCIAAGISVVSLILSILLARG